MFRRSGVKLLRLPLVSRIASSRYSSANKTVRGGMLLSMARFHSQQTNNAPNDRSKPTTSKAKSASNRGKILLLLGILAVGSTIVSINYQKNDPEEFLDEKSFNEVDQKPLFTPDQVSVIFVLGGPGSGKGTQCAKLVDNHHFVHLSAGDLLRAEQAREGSKYGSLIKKYITEGQIVPQEITVQLLKQAIQANYNEGKTKFLVDGFPRKMDQAITFEKVIVPSKFTLFFECPEEVMLRRLLERGKTSGRDDDNIGSIKKRFKTFVDTSMPVVEYFEKQSKVVKVRCNDPIDVVYGHVEAAIRDKI